MNELDQKRRGPLLWLAARTWKFWVVLVVGLPILYVASFGPACWIMARWVTSSRTLPAIYRPVGALAHYTRCRGPLFGYAECGMPKGKLIEVPISATTSTVVSRK